MALSDPNTIPVDQERLRRVIAGLLDLLVKTEIELNTYRTATAALHDAPDLRRSLREMASQPALRAEAAAAYAPLREALSSFASANLDRASTAIALIARRGSPQS